MFEIKTNRKPGELGIFSDISNEDYHAGEGVSSSRLEYLIKCPAKFFNIHRDKESTEFGKAFHCYFLEPDVFYKTYGVLYEPNGAKKAAKDEKKALEEAGYKEFVKEIELLGFEKMKEAIMQDAMGNGLFNEKIRQRHYVEHSGYWMKNDVLCRFRPDVFFVIGDELYIVDLKTTPDCSPDKLSYSIRDWNYNRQAAFYVDGMKNFFNFQKIHIIHLFVEKTMEGNSPWTKEELKRNNIQVLPVIISDAAIEKGRCEYEHALNNYKRFVENKKELPGYKQMFQLSQLEPTELVEIDLPYSKQRNY